MSIYFEHKDKVLQDDRFEHMMALTLDPTSNYKKGLVRCILNREGDVKEEGFVDKSELYIVEGDNLDKFTIKDKLDIKNEKEVIRQLSESGYEFLGLEDPDIWVDETGLIHLYFTMPFLEKNKNFQTMKIYLGHAVGDNLESLEMLKPVLQSEKETAKEVAIAPLNSRGVRYNLFESSIIENDVWYSTVRIGIANNAGSLWKFGDTIIDPRIVNIDWLSGHASPGPFFSKDYINVGDGMILGVLNGREKNKVVKGKTVYGMFSVGLFVYNYEEGRVVWISKEPMIIDSEATSVTFASQLVEIDDSTSILYAHVDDSFVRAYTLNINELLKLIEL